MTDDSSLRKRGIKRRDALVGGSLAGIGTIASLKVDFGEIFAGSALAQAGEEPLSGQPPRGATCSDRALRSFTH